MHFTIPLQTVSGMNAREHHMARSRRVKKERESIAWWVARREPPAAPCTVTLTRLAPSNGLDDDNLASSMKGVVGTRGKTIPATPQATPARPRINQNPRVMTDHSDR